MFDQQRLNVPEGCLARAQLVTQPPEFYVLHGHVVRLEDETELVKTEFNFLAKEGFCDSRLGLLQQLLSQIESQEKAIKSFKEGYKQLRKHILS